MKQKLNHKYLGNCCSYAATKFNKRTKSCSDKEFPNEGYYYLSNGKFYTYIVYVEDGLIYYGIPIEKNSRINCDNRLLI